MDDTNKTDVTDTFVPDFNLTGTNRVLMEEITEGSTVIHQYHPEEPHVGWVQRLLDWFRAD